MEPLFFPFPVVMGGLSETEGEICHIFGVILPW